LIRPARKPPTAGTLRRPAHFRLRAITRAASVKAAGLAALVLMAFTAVAQGTLDRVVFRTAVTPQDRGGTFAVRPLYGRDSFATPLYGRDLPPGSGKAAAGAKIFATRCSACHSLHGSKTPAGHMEQCWRYPKMLFNFVKRAMPAYKPGMPARPGSLKDDEIYALVAYLLSHAGIINPNEVMNAITLPRVAMPNRDGLIPNACPQLSLYR
jgi:mono/diheme cytochrome c family protein